METATTLLQATVPRTLDAWVEALRADRPPEGVVARGWLFEGAAARRAAEARLAADGIRARFHSAYKPLVHHFEEDVERDGLDRVAVRYPVHPQAPPRRFALEAYPLAAMLAGAALVLEPRPVSQAVPCHEVELHWRDGRRRTDTVFAPNRLHRDPTGDTALSPCAWFRGAPAASDYEEVFRRALRALRRHGWPAAEPYFQRLDIRVDLPGVLRPPGGAWIDLHEAMHEELYFSALEMFQRRSGRAPGDRRMRPGQIVPDVRAGADGSIGLRVTLRPYPEPAVDEAASHPRGAPETDADAGRAPLAQAAGPLSPARIAAEMDALPGRRFAAISRQGRVVRGLHHRVGAPVPAVVLSAGQHGNETSGIVGALRAARVLAARPDADFALIALENPDGYALHRELCARGLAQRRHMQHAARYTALGDDLEHRDGPPCLEGKARHQAFESSGATLHVNLHGYPAHEWTRPLNGYIPRGFASWTVPKGFFLLLRHRPGWGDRARRLADHVCRRLAGRADLMAFNAAQLATYNTHAGELPFEIVHGTPCGFAEVDRPGPALTLITEFPDETVHGDPFILAHDTQSAAVLAAVEALSLISPCP